MCVEIYPSAAFAEGMPMAKGKIACSTYRRDFAFGLPRNKFLGEKYGLVIGKSLLIT
jgi:hypothetical protein